MYTVIETAIFQKHADAVWSDAEREAFVGWIAQHPEAGDVIPGTRGLRKVRWMHPGRGKRGGTRVIYHNRLDQGHIWLLIVYAKAKFDNLPVTFLNTLKQEMIDG